MGSIRFDEVEQWLFEAAWPFWARAGVDRADGGFVEFLTLEGRDGGAPFKRTRAQARQIYCFSQAALMGFAPGAEIADHGWRFLMQNGRREDGAWVRQMGRSGGVLDPTCDLYDMSFVLYAHAWRYRATQDPAVIDSALATVEATNRFLRHPTQPGWLAEEGDAGPRQQNPHMHLLEAAVELASATGHPLFADLAREVAELFARRFYDPKAGVLREFFADDWSPLPGPTGDIVEPGHLMEWAWLLYRAQDLLGLKLGPQAEAMVDFTLAHGRAPATGLVYDQVDSAGAVLKADHRSWPQTETIKGLLARFEHGGGDTRAEIAVSVDNLLGRFLAPAPRGTWIDHFDADGRPLVDKIPSTTLYHLQLAFTELLRLRPRLEAL
ncbi:MAG: Mannose-6-phosphate isomerase [Caulobacteraceae bacterium]|nr:Mannose-6-phosphate isomerase [Caulobacteraceae bacterium]